MTKLAISLATRARPDRLLEQIKRSVPNWGHPDTYMQIQVDADDQATIKALESAMPFEALLPLDTQRIEVNIKPREDTVAGKWNRILDVPADIYCYHADDDPYITKDYDLKIIEAAARFPDKIGTVFGHLANLSFSCTYAATAKYCELLGYLLPPYFPYWFCDHWTDDVARMTGRIAFANITTDQGRPGVTMEMREPYWWATFFDAAYLMRRSQAHAIIDHPHFVCPQWQKQLLKTGHPLIEVRSRMLNQQVRNQSPELSRWAGNLPFDERYTRTKQQAIAMVPHLLNDYGMPEKEQQMFRKMLGV